MGNGMNKIIPGLYIGNFRDAQNKEQLEKNNITHILAIYDNAKPILQDKVYLCIRASDTPEQDLVKHFMFTFIYTAPNYIIANLTHTRYSLAGVSRSVTVSVAYIMSVTDHSWRDTLNAVRQSRSVASPNFGFQRQLQAFENNKVVQERQRMTSSFGDVNKAKDQSAIQKLVDDHNRKEEERKNSSPPKEQGSGSTNSSFPLNKPDDVLSYDYKSKKRGGMIVDLDTE
uniref:Dual specificity protein phosphatase 15 n=1 Tax=Ciona intestinalis TaxID=7719 RepID=H2Y1V3_CIOIN